MNHHTEEQPFISVCIPTYNGRLYIENTLQSIAGQSYRNFEILLIDDHSKDDTLEIVGRFAGEHNGLKIRILRNQKNLGLVGNWNRSIREARGDWIKFVFQDDLIEPGCLEKLAAATGDGIPLIFCRREFFFEPGVSDEILQTYGDIPGIDALFPGSRRLSGSDIAKGIMQETRNFFGEPTSTLIHKSVFDRFGPFNERMVQLCDMEYWIRVGLNTGIRYIPETLVRFRVHPSSTSALNGSERYFRSSLLDRLILLHEYAYNPHYRPLREYVKKSGIERNFKRELARKAAWLKNHGEALNNDAENSFDARSDWRNVASAYPRIVSSPYLIPYKIRDWLDRRILWRFHADKN